MNEASIHGHAILHYIQDNAPVPEEKVKTWALAEFGSDALYHTCFASDMDLPTLIEALKDLGKLQQSPEGLTFGDGTHICDHE